MDSSVLRIEARSHTPADLQNPEEITVDRLQRLVLKGIGTK